MAQDVAVFPATVEFSSSSDMRGQQHIGTRTGYSQQRIIGTQRFPGVAIDCYSGEAPILECACQRCFIEGATTATAQDKGTGSKPVDAVLRLMRSWLR